LHVHGGPAIIKAVLKAIPACGTAASKIRYAEAGEFTRRAFLNDRLDLTQAEALGNALDAVTEQQRRQSVRGTAGRLAKQYEDWRGLLLYARGELEALIDFSEDQHFDESPAMLAASVATQVRGLRARIAVYVENAVRGELLRSGISVALLGQPNAGKSSLLNLIVGREAAIVSREAGTTRDVVEVSVDLGGYLCRFSDTAGLRSATTALNGGHTESSIQPIGLVEKEGIARAKRRALESDVVIVLLSHEHDSNGTVHLNIDHDVLETAHQCAEQGAQVIIAVNKSDLAPIAESDPTATDAVRPAVERLQRSLTQGSGSVPLLWISCRQAGDPTLPHSGIKPLLNALISTFEQMTSALRPDTAQDGADQLSLIDNSLWQDSLGASERQRLLLEECAAQLDSFLAQVSNASGNDMDIVIAAESLRAAAECLARITGRGDAGDVEEVLGVVFEK
jgi:tRNA modification GTPase